MREGFGRSEEGFMVNWGPKVTQLAPLTSLGLKARSVTMPDPIRHPWRRSAHPGATHRVSNTHTDQGGSSFQFTENAWAG